MVEITEPFSVHTEHPVFQYGKSYLYYSVIKNELIMFSFLPALNIPAKMKETKFGIYDAAINKSLRKDHFKVETQYWTGSDTFPPGCLRSVDSYEKHNFGLTISWYSDLFYIGEV